MIRTIIYGIIISFTVIPLFASNHNVKTYGAAGDGKTIDSPAINKAIDAGIPVITFGNDAPESKRLCYVGTDDYKAGWVAGKEVSQWLNGKGEVGISTYTGLGFLDKRVKGFGDIPICRFSVEIIFYGFGAERGTSCRFMDIRSWLIVFILVSPPTNVFV